MRIYRNIDHLPAFRRAVITIGTFDGVHAGHQKILEQLRQEAARIDGETVIITFHPHPRKIVKGASAEIRLINTLREKIGLAETLPACRPDACGLQGGRLPPGQGKYAHWRSSHY